MYYENKTREKLRPFHRVYAYSRPLTNTIQLLLCSARQASLLKATFDIQRAFSMQIKKVE